MSRKKLTEEEKRQSQRIASKKWREKNKDKVQDYQTKYLEKNRDKIREYQKEYEKEQQRKESKKRAGIKYRTKNRELLREKNKLYRKENSEFLKQLRNERKEQIKFSAIKTRYNLSKEKYIEILNQQNNCCAICLCSKESLPNKTLHVDHCHSTGIVRGLLCGSCNRALGLFKENKDYLSRTIEYLEKKHES